MNFATPENTKILSPAFYPYSRLNIETLYLRKSSEYLGIPISYYGKNKKYTQNSDIKVQQLLNEILKVDKKYILVLDSNDLVIQKPFSDICKSYNEYGKKVVITGSRNFWPEIKRLKYPECENRYRYINSGVIMGEREELIKILKEMVLLKKKIGTHIHEGSDQYLWHNIYCENRYDITVDYKQLISTVVAMQSKRDLYITNGYGYVKDVNSFPCIVHMNGNLNVYKKKFFNKILERLKFEKNSAQK